ncbi:MAG: hypothetical protein JOZ49_10375, partial [Mycolicibacterium sp.]|nr:hypothetical protein [Mycolicibacterium sp.]
GGFDPAIGRKAPIYVQEEAPWSAFRDRDHPYGFVVFDVDPGHAGHNTTIKATHFAITGPFGEVTPVDEFLLTRPRTAVT